MKKLFLALLAAGTVSAANAQMPNSWLVYGNIGLHTTKDTSGNSKTINWNANPGIGYQFNKNWTAGISLGWSQSALHETESGTTYKTTENNYQLGVFARYSSYIGDSKTFFWFGQADLQYHGGYTTAGDEPASYKHNGFTAGVTPALGINVGRAWALNFSIGSFVFNSDKMSGASNSATSFDVTFGNQYNFGISKNIGGHMHHGHHEPGDEMRHMDTSDDSNDSGDNSNDNGGRHRRHRHHHNDNDDNSSKKDKNNDE